MEFRRLSLDQPVDVALTLSPMRHGLGDPTIRISGSEVWRATRTPEGPAAMHIRQSRAEVEIRAWGEGAKWMIEMTPDLLGLHDDVEAFRPRDQLMRDLHKRFAGMRIPRSRAVVEALLPAIIEQKVTGSEAWRAHRRLVTSLSQPAPGPGGLMLPPSPEALAGLPYFSFHPFGIERRRAETIRRVCAAASRLEEAAAFAPEEAARRLRSVPGVGAWTVAEVARVAFGDSDAVSVGDYHLPHMVAWALAGEVRASDDRMLELLEPYRGQRGRAARLIEVAGLHAPKFGPRRRVRDLSRM